MPIYQYDCAACKKRVDVFFRSISRVGDPKCPECGSTKLKRVMSKVMRARSDADRLADIDINQELGRMDSKNIGDLARWSKDMGRRFDGALGSNFSQLAARAEAGDDPVERFDPAHTLKYQISKAKRGGRAGADETGDAPAP